ncbi:hypothetical protein [Enterococcus sp. AZ058]|uniref:hypothetical protein n=1 Tax=Enterococcus sp. AZ058 TaxID=2774838 RepID=UPI003D275450
MDNTIEISKVVSELNQIIKNTSLDSFEKRKLQSYILIANCNGPSDEYKDLLSEITHMSFSIQNYLKENNLDLNQIIKSSNDLTDEDKQVLLSSATDLDYLVPHGGFIELLPGLEFTPDTVEAIKYWAGVVIGLASVCSILPKGIKSIQEIMLNHENIEKAKIENQISKLELQKMKKELTRSDRHNL